MTAAVPHSRPDGAGDADADAGADADAVLVDAPTVGSDPAGPGLPAPSGVIRFPRRLAVRLVGAFFVVLVTAAGLPAVVTSRAAGGTAAGYLVRAEQTRAVRAAAALGRFRDARDDWSETDAWVAAYTGAGGDRIVVVDARGAVVADATGQIAPGASFPRPVPADWFSAPVPDRRPSDRRAGVTEWGTLYVDRPGAGTAPAASLAAVLRRTVWWGAAAGAAAALALGALFARRIARPIGALTAAAGRLATGDGAARVAEDGDDELALLAATFNRMAERVVATEAARQRLVTDVAHELRGPLTNIRGYLEGMQDGLFPLDATHLAILVEEAGRLDRLVEDLREVSFAESGALRLDRRPCAIDALARAAVEAARPRAHAVGVGLAVVAQPLTVDADQDRLGQVLGNLLANAIAHTPRGGTVTVRVAPTSGGVLVAVEDTGSGIAEEDLPHIFDRFYRADRSRARGADGRSGTGLGLAIVRAIVVAHGGTVRAANRPSSGTRFTVVLPVEA